VKVSKRDVHWMYIATIERHIRLIHVENEGENFFKLSHLLLLFLPPIRSSHFANGIVSSWSVRKLGVGCVITIIQQVLNRRPQVVCHTGQLLVRSNHQHPLRRNRLGDRRQVESTHF